MSFPRLLLPCVALWLAACSAAVPAPDAATRIYVVRHAESWKNVDHPPEMPPLLERPARHDLPMAEPVGISVGADGWRLLEGAPR